MKQTNIINSEIKARCRNHQKIRDYLVSHNADFKGTDHQIDTYFNVKSGRLKLREGSIENNLIFYNRSDQAGPKQSEISFAEINNPSSLRPVLEKALGVKVEVDKTREIYFIDNVKFHIDTVKGLGTFMEIEAIDWDGSIGPKKLQEQCEFYALEMAISEKDLVKGSYSDLLMNDIAHE
ncbi:MAG: class IV adenylate cyclase [Acidobacteriota bacterium]